MSNTLNADPQTKADWSYLLDYLYQHWVKCKLPVTVYPPARCRGSLRLDGIISYRTIGRIA